MKNDHSNGIVKLKKQVFETYERRADEVIQEGYRHQPWYIANKALSDWELLMQAKPQGKHILNVGSFEPIDEVFFVELVDHWTACDINPDAVAMAQKLSQKYLNPELFRK